MNHQLSCISLVAAVFVWSSVGSSARQSPPTPASEIADAVWAAVQPALPYPSATSDDQPEDGSVESLWIVRRLDGAGGLVAEVLANPLNADNQKRAEKAMAAIQEAVTRAERRAQAEYERATSGASRGRTSRELTGISLDDEGVAGERADWEARLLIEVHGGQTQYEWRVGGSASPQTTPIGQGTVISIDAAEYDEGAGAERRRRYRPAEARLFFGIVPLLKKSDGAPGYLVDVAAIDAPRGIEVIVRGNPELLKDVLAKADWALLRK